MYIGLSDKIWHRPTLPRITAVPSALAGLTSLFGMGRGRHRRYRHLNIFSLSQEVREVRKSVRLQLNFVFVSVLISSGLFRLSDFSDYKQWHIIERSKFKRKQQLLLSVCCFVVVPTLLWGPFNSTRRKLRAISITRLWCHHLYTCNLST